MPQSQSGENESKKSRKKLVRWLVILGIGIPVLVELLTLFNLINVQFTDEEQQLPNTSETATERAVVEGDTLFKSSADPLVIRQLLIKVNAQEWEFELGLAYAGDAPGPDTRFTIDSLLLNSGTVLQSQNVEWEIDEGQTQLEAKWDLPPGDIPTALFLSTFQQFSSDSLAKTPREIKLNKIPVRYNTDQ